MNSDSEQLLINLGKRLNQANVESNTVAESVDRFKIFFEELNYVDELIKRIPKIAFKETLGTSPYFRFDYDRFDYGRFGDVGGMDDMSYLAY